MPTGVVHTERDEEKWDKAKSLAAEQGHAGDFAYIMGIYKKMKPSHEFEKESQMTPFEQGYHLFLKCAGLQKEAVTLQQMRQATTALKERVPLIRRSLHMPDYFNPKLTPRKVREGVAQSHGMGPQTVPALPEPHLDSFLHQKLAPNFPDMEPDAYDGIFQQVKTKAKAMNAPLMPGGRTTIFQGGNPAELFADHLLEGRVPAFNTMRASGPGQEAFNRWVLMHEGAEAGKHFGDRAISSHLTTRPLLHDMNIAATLEGPGQEAAEAIRTLREPEVEAMAKYVPGLERLNLGEQRVSRHAQKRLQEAYERGLNRAGVRGIPALNVDV